MDFLQPKGLSCFQFNYKSVANKFKSAISHKELCFGFDFTTLKAITTRYMQIKNPDFVIFRVLKKKKITKNRKNTAKLELRFVFPTIFIIIIIIIIKSSSLLPPRPAVFFSSSTMIQHFCIVGVYCRLDFFVFVFCQSKRFSNLLHYNFIDRMNNCLPFFFSKCFPWLMIQYRNLHIQTKVQTCISQVSGWLTGRLRLSVMI